MSLGIQQKDGREVKAVLGPATVSAIVKVRDDHSLTVEQKAQKIYDIMKAVPESTLRRIPFPPRMRSLPAPILERIRAVAVNKSLTLSAKIKEGEKIIMSLTPEQKKLLPTLADVYQ
ncbi:hypothetical protein Tcan_16078 [Toxocara canis]|uniref:Uncharacterized protein n=1 Tax=Toxocara canis TaxID=6265 RepID=A0A0B2V3E2_TOXCA|nr:hypothetical protein Tcan_16078 [Toxocara canis]